MGLTQMMLLMAAMVGGAASAAQSLMNSSLGRSLADPLLAALWSFATGFLLLAACLLLRGGAVNFAELAAAPRWTLFGGVAGALFVVAMILVVPRLGVLSAIAAVVLGQLIAALIFDGLNPFGSAPDVTTARLAAVALVFGGLVLSRL